MRTKFHEHQKETYMAVHKMKAILTAIVMIGLLSSFTLRYHTPGGKKQLPKVIAPSFSAKYPQAKIRNWKCSGDEYIVRYEEGKDKCAAYFSTGGQWIKTEYTIPWTRDLPQAVRTSIQNNGYGIWYVDGIKKVETAGRLLYVLHVDDGSTLDSDHYDAFRDDYLLTFTPDGVLTEKVSI
jgi:hypothetical protein